MEVEDVEETEEVNEEDENEDDDGEENDVAGDNKEEDDDDEEDSEEEVEEEITKKGKKAPLKKPPTKKTSANKAPSKKVPEKKKAKTAKEKASEKETKKKTVSKTQVEVKEGIAPKPKTVTKIDRLEEARLAFKWWETPVLEEGVNWKELEHAGIIFAPPYVRHNVPLIYDGEKIKLTLEQEELASFYAAMPDDGPQLGNPKTRDVFQKNFFKDFLETFTSGSTVKHFNKCDFSLIKQHLDREKTLKKAASDFEKKQRKQEVTEKALKHGYALIDGRIEKMGNYNMEPPGLFRGRGEHPKTGSVKTRSFAESVSINLSENACIPKAHLPGHAWNSVRHDPCVTWLCSWIENVQDQNKYVHLAASSSFKGRNDVEKYDKAIRLKHCIGTVRKDYTNNIKSKDRADRQLGTAMWIIDNLALRVGGEKGEDEADTVGCCSLRKEHLNFNPNPETYEIELEFLGKDSMLYKQNINFARYGDLGKLVYQCLKSFCAGKSSDDDIFETLNPTIMNQQLSSLMKGLSAKVFRTYNASITLEKELPSAEDLKGLDVAEKVIRYNAANREVAILCNHQKTVSKAAETMFENLHEKLNTLKSQRNKLIEWKGLCKKKQENKIPVKKEDKDTIDKLKDAVALASKKKEAAITPEEKIYAAELLEAAKVAQKEDTNKRFQDKHYFKATPTESSVDVKIDNWSEQIRKLEVDIRNRDENKEVALGTSKINYMDPRISVAWCKRCEVPIDKIFAKTLRDKFNWAMAVPPSWKFE